MTIAANPPGASDIRPGRLDGATLAANFADLHPPLTPHEAGVEADRCYFCYDAPCDQACPTGIDIPLFIRQIATGNLDGSAHDHSRRQHLRRHLRARLPDRDVVRGGLRARGRRRQAGRDRPVAALCHRPADREPANRPFARAAPTGKRVAVVGAGPAGLACAHALALPAIEFDDLRGAREGRAGSTSMASPPTRSPTISPPGGRFHPRSAASRSGTARRSAATSRWKTCDATSTPCSWAWALADNALGLAGGGRARRASTPSTISRACARRRTCPTCRSAGGSW